MQPSAAAVSIHACALVSCCTRGEAQVERLANAPHAPREAGAPSNGEVTEAGDDAGPPVEVADSGADSERDSELTPGEPLREAQAPADACRADALDADLNGRLGDFHVEALAPSLSREDRRDRPAIALEPGGAVHVVASALYGTNRSGVWETQAIAQGGARWSGVPGLAVTPGHVRLSFIAEGSLHYALGEAAAWTVERIHDAPVRGQALALTSTEVPVVAFLGDDALGVATRGADGWDTTWLEAGSDEPKSPSYRPVAMVAGAAAVHLAYLWPEGEQCRVRYGTLTSSDWRVETAQEGVGCGSVALALAPDGAPHLAFSVGDTFVLAERRGGAWTRRETSIGTSEVFDIAADGAGTIHVVAALEGRAGYSTLGAGQRDASSGPTWGGFGGQAIALGGDGIAHVAFVNFDFTNFAQVFHCTQRMVSADGVDSNCDGVDGVDADGDGQASVWSGGSDCDDWDESVTGSCRAGR